MEGHRLSFFNGCIDDDDDEKEKRKTTNHFTTWWLVKKTLFLSSLIDSAVGPSSHFLLLRSRLHIFWDRDRNRDSVCVCISLRISCLDIIYLTADFSGLYSLVVSSRSFHTLTTLHNWLLPSHTHRHRRRRRETKTKFLAFWVGVFFHWWFNRKLLYNQLYNVTNNHV